MCLDKYSLKMQYWFKSIGPNARPSVRKYSLIENERNYSPVKFKRNNSTNDLPMSSLSYIKENPRDIIEKRNCNRRKSSEGSDSFENFLNEEENKSNISSPGSVRSGKSGSVRSITSMSTVSELFLGMEEAKKVRVWMQSEEISHMMEVECTEGTTVMTLAKRFNKELGTL